MPANLPPQYFEAEKRYRAVKSPLEKVAALEDMLAIMPKHKGTDHLRAELRSRIAKLTQEAEKKSSTKRASMLIDKEGAAQVAVIGLPNSGKSRLVTSITNASLLVAEYPFTTHTATPGMMKFENIQIQLIDTPPIAPQSIEWWLPPMLRRSDALLIMIDLGNDALSQVNSITTQLEKMHIKINTDQTLEDVINPQKSLIVANKIDLDKEGQNYITLQSRYKDKVPLIAISCKDNIGLEELKQKMYQVLNIIRIYTKAPGQKPDFNDPIILERGSTLADAAAAVHKDFAINLKFARIWGSGKHDGIMAKKNHILQDGDIVELHKQK